MPVTQNGKTIPERLQRLTGMKDPLRHATRVGMARGSDKKRISMLRSAIEYLKMRLAAANQALGTAS
jgi:hypothetical protein